MIPTDFEKIKAGMPSTSKREYYYIIWRNVKKFRLEKYNDFKSNNSHGIINPYSTESIAELLDYNHNHYKRFESETDTTKQFPLDKLVKLSVILDKSLDELIKK